MEDTIIAVLVFISTIVNLYFFYDAYRYAKKRQKITKEISEISQSLSSKNATLNKLIKDEIIDNEYRSLF